MIVYDLRMDPDQWLSLDVAAIRERVYTPSAALAERGLERIPLKTIHANKCPIVSAASVLSPEQAARFEIDLGAIAAHREKLLGSRSLQRKLVEVFREEHQQSESDPDFMIYSGGFFGERDKSLMETIRATAPRDLARLDLPFQDRRLSEMLFRYRARNYPDSLNHEEQKRWQKFCLARLQADEARARFAEDSAEAQERIAATEDAGEVARQSELLAALDAYIDQEIEKLSAAV